MDKVKQIISNVLENNQKMTADQAAYLFECKSKEALNLIKNGANELRKELVGDKVSYIVNLNANFTNICDSFCIFCGFRRNDSEPDAYILDLNEFEPHLDYNVKQLGITEVCFQGGLYSKLKINGFKSVSLLDTYAELLSWVKDRYPDLHIHAYSPEEIEFLSVVSGKSEQYILEYFKDSGLDSMPGTAAEILVDEIRKKICSKKLNTQKWVDIIKLAHKLGIPSTATIMYGHFESSSHKAKHLEILRNIQEETNGFTEFIPLPLIPDRTHLRGKVVPLTSIDRLKLLAISRLFFGKDIKNIQASWVKQGFEETAESLDWGCNDIGGTLGDERITQAAGGCFGKGVTKEQLVEIITSKNRVPMQRDTLYLYQKEIQKEKILI